MPKMKSKYLKTQPERSMGSNPGVSVGGMVAPSNTRSPRRRMGTSSYEFAEGGVHSETVLESGGPEKEDTVIARYRRTGRHLGKFDTPDAADRYALALGRMKKR